MRALREEVTELKRQLTDRSDELKAKATQVKNLEKQVNKLEGMQGETLQNATQMQGKAELVQRQLEEYMRKVADADSAKRKHDEYRREMEAELETTVRFSLLSFVEARLHFVLNLYLTPIVTHRRDV